VTLIVIILHDQILQDAKHHRDKLPSASVTVTETVTVPRKDPVVAAA
jgi:hypothetical protein